MHQPFRNRAPIGPDGHRERTGTPDARMPVKHKSDKTVSWHLDSCNPRKVRHCLLANGCNPTNLAVVIKFPVQLDPLALSNYEDTIRIDITDKSPKWQSWSSRKNAAHGP
jgi:hypothetical protein